MKNLKVLFFTLSLVFAQTLFATSSQDLELLRTDVEIKVYNETYQQCQSGTLESALKIGHRPEVVLGAAANAFKVFSLQYEAIYARVESHFYSPELYQLRNNNGYWLAIVHCYEHHSFAKKLLIKGLIDMGHLSSEVAGTALTLSAGMQLAKANALFSKQYPLLHRFFAVMGIDLRLYNIFKELKGEFISGASTQELQQLQMIENHLFQEPNKSLELTLNLLTKRLAEIQIELQTPNLSDEQRAHWLQKKERTEYQIQFLRQSLESPQKR